MKKILYFISALTLLFATSCNEKEKGTLFDFGGKDYASFGAKEYSFDASPEGKSIVYLYHLTDGTGSTTFTISADYHGAEDVLSVSPSQITFDKDNNQAVIEIRYDKNKMGVYEPYTVTLSIPEQKYPAGTVVETQKVTITLQPVWQHYADGIFESEFYEDSWEQEIQKADGLEVYRLPSLYADGVDFVFKLEDESTGEVSIPLATPNQNGLYRWETGYVYGSYGSVYGLLNPDTNYTWFDKAGKNANFNSQFRVTAGSFGWLDETLTW